MNTRRALVALAALAVTTVVCQGQTRFRTYDSEKQWTMCEYRLNDFSGSGTGDGKARAYDEHGEYTEVVCTWVVNGSDVEIWMGGTAPSHVFVGGANQETGEVQGTSNTWTNIDFT